MQHKKVLIFFQINCSSCNTAIKINNVKQDREQQSVIVQGIYRSNYVILGIPIVSNIYKGDNIATITMLIAIRQSLPAEA